MFRYIIFAALLPALSVSNSALAQDSDETNLSLGGALLYLPEYAGAKEMRKLVVPNIAFENLYGFDFQPFNLTYPLIERKGGEGFSGWSFSAGARATFDFGRDENDGDELLGLGDISASFPVGGFVKGRYGPLAFTLQGGQDVAGGHGGTVIEGSLGTRLPLGKGGSIIPSVSANWGSRDYQQTLFGITQAQAAASGFEAYDIGAGIESYSASIVTLIPLPNEWNLNAVVSYRKYTGDTALSPIITGPQGSTDAVFSVIGISRKFGL